jgi:hypothetical protein
MLQGYIMHAGKIVLALAVVLVVAHAAEPQAAQPQRAAPTPFGTLNGLYQKWSGSPLVIHGFSECSWAVLLLLLLQVWAFSWCSQAQPINAITCRTLLFTAACTICHCCAVPSLHLAAAGAIQTSTGGKGLLISGAQLTPSTTAGALVGPATAVTGSAKYIGLSFDR